jgi:hypothetical protein
MLTNIPVSNVHGNIAGLFIGFESFGVNKKSNISELAMLSAEAKKIGILSENINSLWDPSRSH